MKTWAREMHDSIVLPLTGTQGRRQPEETHREFLNWVKLMASPMGKVIVTLHEFQDALFDLTTHSNVPQGVGPPILATVHGLVKQCKTVEMFLLAMGATDSLRAFRQGDQQERAWKDWVKGEMHARDWSFAEKETMLKPVIKYPYMLYRLGAAVKEWVPSLRFKAHQPLVAEMVQQHYLPELNLEGRVQSNMLNGIDQARRSLRGSPIYGDQMFLNTEGFHSNMTLIPDMDTRPLIVQAARVLWQHAALTLDVTDVSVGVLMNMLLYIAMGQYLAVVSLTVLLNFGSHPMYATIFELNQEGDIFDKMLDGFLLAGVNTLQFSRCMLDVANAYYAKELLGFDHEKMKRYSQRHTNAIAPQLIGGVVGTDMFEAVQLHEYWVEVVSADLDQFLSSAFGGAGDPRFKVSQIYMTQRHKGDKIYIFDHPYNIEVLGAPNLPNGVRLASPLYFRQEYGSRDAASILLNRRPHSVLDVGLAYKLLVSEERVILMDPCEIVRRSDSPAMTIPFARLYKMNPWALNLFLWGNMYHVGGCGNTYSRYPGMLKRHYSDSMLGQVVVFRRCMVYLYDSVIDWELILVWFGALRYCVLEALNAMKDKTWINNHSLLDMGNQVHRGWGGDVMGMTMVQFKYLTRFIPFNLMNDWSHRVLNMLEELPSLNDVMTKNGLEEWYFSELWVNYRQYFNLGWMDHEYHRLNRSSAPAFHFSTPTPVPVEYRPPPSNDDHRASQRRRVVREFFAEP